jgi:hypothetical protein
MSGVCLMKLEKMGAQHYRDVALLIKRLYSGDSER